jgi:hypothetical protein
MLVADYTFWDALWTMFAFFIWIMWFWLLFGVFADVFRRDDLSGLGKAGWLIFVIVLPFLGVFIYLIVNNEGMTKRTLAREGRQRAQFDEYVRDTASAGGVAAEIDKAKQLLDSGAITQAEFETLKARALA